MTGGRSGRGTRKGARESRKGREKGIGGLEGSGRGSQRVRVPRKE